jgi:hypothetical protein
MFHRRIVLLLVGSIVCFSGFSQLVWKVRPQGGATEGAEELCRPDHDVRNWVNAIVPGTVFASYVAAGLEADPNFGDNIYKVDKSKYDRNFWYRTTFETPVGGALGAAGSSVAAGAVGTTARVRTWLNFKGINRKADIYLNGVRLGALNGFMQRGRYDITEILKRQGVNVLAVLVYLPEQPLGNYASPSYISSAGWDWMPYVPGLNMGITDEVYLSYSGDALLENPWIRTDLATNARADLSVTTTVKNVSDTWLQAELRGVIQPGNIQFSQKVGVQPHRGAEIKLDSRQLTQLSIDNPKLWWPNGYGEPHLYTCQLSLVVGGVVSDSQRINFGIKKYTYDTAGNVLHLSINGTRVFIKGGDWGMSEYMLRCRGKEYDTKVRLHKEMHFNMIRNWIGSTTDEDFYDACDKYGIMVWDDFWLNANPNLPADVNNFNANAIEKIERFRNHASIAVWCADNEGWPEPPLSAWLKEDIAVYDGGDRYYQPNSHAENLSGSGLWGSHDPRWYFTPYPTSLGGNRGWGLRTEMGTAVFTNFESFKKFMPKDKWWPRNELWNRHFFGPLAFNAGPDDYEASIKERYGAPSGIEDFCRKAQLLNIETNKAMYEGWEDHMWEDASGLMTWMSQSAYPSLVWQTYDYYYDLTGAYWGAKSACEPLHVQWNPVNNFVKVINTTALPATLTATAEVYTMDGRLTDRYSQSKTLTAPANTASHAFTLAFNDDQRDLALHKPAFASSSTTGTPLSATDGDGGTRWASAESDHQWLYVDLGKEENVNGVVVNWEEAFGKSFKIQVSDDARSWQDVYFTNEGHPGRQRYDFEDASARYVRVLGLERGSGWGYSLWDLEVYGSDLQNSGLTAVHFIKLQLKDQMGAVVSSNFYWRGNKKRDFTALNTLPAVGLKVSQKLVRPGLIEARISSPGVAFAIRVQALKASTGEQLLPAIVSDSYFTLFKGETKTVTIEFDPALPGGDEVKVVAEAYNAAGHAGQ